MCKKEHKEVGRVDGFVEPKQQLKGIKQQVSISELSAV